MLERFNKFTVLILALARNIRKIKVEEMAKWGLKSYHVSCIYYLYLYKTLTAKELCDICEEDKANISRSIEYLEHNGLLKFEDEQKRYKNHFRLTEKGLEIGMQLFEKAQIILGEASRGLSSECRKTMYDSLELINNNLQKISDSYTK